MRCGERQGGSIVLAMATDLQFINAAATRTGSDPITSLTQGGAVADIANQNYERIVLAELAAYRWKWATKFEVLNLLNEGDAQDPWLYAYERPTDALNLRGLSVSGVRIDYAVVSDKIMADYGSDAEVIAAYIWRPPESQWPAWFAEPITRRMEAVFLRAIGERTTEAEVRDAAADGTGQYQGKSGTFAAARKMDAQSDTARDPWRYGILEARRA